MDAVDLALILAFDGSASVTFDEFNLMAGGTAAALREPAVVAGLSGGPRGASLAAVCCGRGARTGGDDRRGPASNRRRRWRRSPPAVEDMPRMRAGGGDRDRRGAGGLRDVCCVPRRPPARRLVIDMVGDGRSQRGRAPGPVRDRLVAAGVTINGLCVLHEEPDLLESYTAR